MPENRLDLRQIFLGLQAQMAHRMTVQDAAITHRGTKGAAREQCFLDLLATYLPRRYRAGQGFVLDCDGQCSDQLDLIIYDRQYSPFLFKEQNTFYIPAEGVYAVFEVKSALVLSAVQYAGVKAASVRRLKRTSAPITHAGGTFPPRPPFDILAGILTLTSTWSPPFGRPFLDTLATLAPLTRIDLVCALHAGAADLHYDRDPSAPPKIEHSRPDDTLIFFFLHLLARLQDLGTVPAMDIRQWAHALHP